MKLRDERIKWQNARKEFTEPLDERKKIAIERERAITSNIIPYEEELKAKKEAYDAEKERIKAEKEAEEMRILQTRIDELTKYGVTAPLDDLKAMSDDGFRMMADMWKKKWEEKEAIRLQEEAEKKRIEDEAEKKRQEEAEAVRKQKEENDRIANEQAQKALELAKKEKAIKDKENEQKRQEDLENARKEGEEKAKKEKEDEEARQKKFLDDQEKYTEWLKSHGFSEETKLEYTTTIKRDGNISTVTLYKKISTFELTHAE
jgi:nucleolar protein involved in exit from mitosis